MKRASSSLLHWVFLLAPLVALAQKDFSLPQSQHLFKNNLVPNTLLNINKMSMWVQNNGRSSANPHGKRWGVMFPRGTAGLVYVDGIVWVGKVLDGLQPIVRTGGGIYSVGTVPGVILSKGIPEDPMSPAARVYRIRRDYQAADLAAGAADFFDTTLAAVTQQMIEAVRAQYEQDWKEWPWQKGAPFFDKNRNGVMDGDDTPGFEEADQVVWFAYNDLDEAVNKAFYGGPSIGLEVQVTLWAYKDIPEFENVIFKRYRIIYKGNSSTPVNAVIDSMYLSQWSDPDAGNFSDDLGGCDSTLSMGFVFSTVSPEPAYKPFGWQNPGIGYTILQGPLVPGSKDDQGVFDFAERKGMKNLPMTSFLLNATGDAIGEPPYGSATDWYWIVARGFSPVGFGTHITSSPWVSPAGELTKFPFSGDPVDRTGWIDGLGKSWSYDTLFGYSAPAGDRRIMLNTGPFRMALGDTQEVVIALLAGMGADGRQSTRVIKYETKMIRAIYPSLAERAREVRDKQKVPTPATVPSDFFLGQNYPNPFNPSTTIEFTLPFEADVRLSIHDVLGKEVMILVEGNKPAGAYKVRWDSRDNGGREVSGGVYFYRLKAGHIEITRKMVFVR